MLWTKTINSFSTHKKLKKSESIESLIFLNTSPLKSHAIDFICVISHFFYIASQS